MGKFNHNYQYAGLHDVHLIELMKKRLDNLSYDFTIEKITVLEKKNNQNDNAPFSVSFMVKSSVEEEIHHLMFTKFYIDEWDYIHDSLESLNFVPVSEVIFRKNNFITNVECSNRGYANALEETRKRIATLYKESVPYR